MKLKDATFTVLDVETTGLYPHYGDKICEIGALRVSPDGRQKKFEVLIDPEKPISPGAFAVNRITEDMLKDKPKVHEVMDRFMDFIEDSVIVAYNAKFDIGFIEAALGERSEILSGARVVDALKLARGLFPSLKKYNLMSVAESLDVHPEVEHRAMADVITTWKVFQKELEILEEKGTREVDEIAQVYVKKDSQTEAANESIETRVLSAINQKAPIKIKYRSLWDNKTTVRTITPVAIREAYVVAYCHLRQANRNFRMDCIVDVNPNRGGSSLG